MYRAAALVTMTGVLLALVAGCSSGGERSFDDPQVAITFQYPTSLKLVNVSLAASAGGAPAVQKAIGLTGDNVIIVTRYDLRRRVVTDKELEQVKPEADKLFSQLARKQMSGSLTEVGGLPAIEYDAFDLQQPAKARSRLLVLFDGVTEYLVNCQSTPDKRAELEKACDLMRDTVQPVGAAGEDV